MEEYNYHRERPEMFDDEIREVIEEVHAKALEDLHSAHISWLKATKGISDDKLYILGRKGDPGFITSPDILIVNINFRILFLYLEATFKEHNATLLTELIYFGLITRETIEKLNFYNKKELDALISAGMNERNGPITASVIGEFTHESISSHETIAKHIHDTFIKLFKELKRMQDLLLESKSDDEDNGDSEDSEDE